MKLIAIDFDGTIVEKAFPSVGKALPGAIETIKDLKLAGYKIMLWTCREDVVVKEGNKNIAKSYLTDAIEFCRENGIEFDCINEGLAEFDTVDSERFLRRKPHVTMVIDDKNIGGFIGWDRVREILLG